MPPSTTKPKTRQLPQKTISVFLCPSNKTPASAKSADIAARKSSLLDRIRARKSIDSMTSRNAEKAAWERGEWCISSLFLYPFS